MNWQCLIVSAALLTATSAMAQRGPIAVPKALPGDVSPRIAPSQCGGFEGHFGPLDFRGINPQDKRVVEQYHFDMELRTFLSGRLVGRNRAGTSEVVGGFDYVLKAIPNHPTALLVMEQLGRKLKSENPQNNELPLECYYLRAFMIAPDDPVVRLMYGIYLAYRGRVDEAKYNLDLGDDGLRAQAAMQHQIGLTNIELKRYEKAQLNALRIRRAAFALKSVEQQLKAAKRWDENLVLPADDLKEAEPEERPESGTASSAGLAALAASAPAVPASR